MAHKETVKINRNDVDTSFKHLNRFSQYNRTDCMLPQCNSFAIKSHSISESRLNLLADRGHVLQHYQESKYDNCRDELSNENGALRGIGVNKAGTFNGYCSFHDNSLFNKIDILSFEENLENFSLNYLRAVSCTLSENQHSCKTLQSSIAETTPGSLEVMLMVLEMLKNMENDVRDLSELHSKILKMIDSMDCENINHICFVYDSLLPFAVSSIFKPTYTLDGKNIKPTAKYGFIGLNVIPQSSSSSLILFSWLEGGRLNITRFLESLKNQFVDNNKYFTDRILLFTLDVARPLIDPIWYNSLNKEDQKLLEQFSELQITSKKRINFNQKIIIPKIACDIIADGKHSVFDQMIIDFNN